MENFVKHCIDNGGIIKPLIIPAEITNGTGLFNPSILNDNGTLLVNVRHCQYTLYHSELNNYEHPWGPLLYLNPDDDKTLRTTNYIGVLDDNMVLDNIRRVDTTSLDKKPLWEFVGLEDGRLVKWDGRYYLTGVRRDVDPIGTGRMELSEIDIQRDKVTEVKRSRIPAPPPNNSYCEKNWMPILDRPFQYIKWSNPVEVVEANIKEENNIQCKTLYHGTFDDSPKIKDIRGASQVIPYKDGYLAVQHLTVLYRSKTDRKNGTYRHQLTYWDKDWNVIKRSPIFSFMGAKIEFCCGMCEHKGYYYITFGYQDNAAYVVKVPEKVLGDFINGK
tara:strand:+ start:952 stop:1944 length:993 start_codon:yes stop_codon:yes gene_type:complete